MSKDYYNILGVEKGADEAAIKKAYRKMAHMYHPDKEGGDEEKFKEVNEAYQVLSDSQKRQAYDQFGEAGVNGAAGGAGGMNWEDIMRQNGFAGGQAGFAGGVDFGDIFSDFFSGGGRRGGQHRPQKGEDIQMDMQVAFEEAAFGVKKTVHMYRAEKCDHCNGNGAEPGTPIKECTTCKGAGVIEQMQRTILGAMRTQAVCHDCRGEGKHAETKCKICHGVTTQKKDIELEVDIPAGIDNGQTIRVTGQGAAGPGGARNGDLYITVHYKPKQGWERSDDTVHTDLLVPYTTMVLGGKIAVETLDGEVELKIPAGTESGKSMRLRGKGIPHLGGSGRGDHIVTVNVAVPKKLSSREKKLLKQLSKADE